MNDLVETSNPKTTKIKRIKYPPLRFPLVLIRWDDAGNLADGWKGAELGEPEQQLVTSVGFLIKDTPEYVILAMDTDVDGHHNTRGQIPRAMIKHMTVVRKAEWKDLKLSSPNESST